MLGRWPGASGRVTGRLGWSGVVGCWLRVWWIGRRGRVGVAGRLFVRYRLVVGWLYGGYRYGVVPVRRVGACDGCAVGGVGGGCGEHGGDAAGDRRVACGGRRI